MRPAMLVAAAVALAPGCASAVGAVPARVLAPGKQEVTGGLGLGVTAAQLSPARPAPLPSAVLSGGYRRGLGERLELGARGWMLGVGGLATYGVSGDVKIGLRDAAESGGRLHLSLDPEIAYERLDYGGSPTHFINGGLALLAGWDLGEGRAHHLVVGAHLQDHVMFGPDVHPVNAVFGGASVAFAWRVSQRLELRPLVAFLWSPVRFNGTLDDPDRRGAKLLELGLGGAFQWGG